MDTEKTWHLLGRGGLTRAAARVGGTEQGSRAVLGTPKYNGLADPAGAEDLGRLLAERARPFSPTAVLLWEDPQDIVLGHIVARELGVTAVRSYNQEGLIDVIGTLPPASRVLLVADMFRDAGLVQAMSNVAARDGGTVVATAVLVHTHALATAGGAAGTVVSLATVADEESPAGGASGHGAP